MTRALKAAVLPSRFTPHALRHAFASLLIQAASHPPTFNNNLGAGGRNLRGLVGADSTAKLHADLSFVS